MTTAKPNACGKKKCVLGYLEDDELTHEKAQIDDGEEISEDHVRGRHVQCTVLS
jgi:hypothetical protein